MKNSGLLRKSLIALLPISLGLGVLLGIGNNRSVEVQGYTGQSCPTNIDLNDTSASDIRSYYSELDEKTESERKGTNLLKNLKTILKRNQKYYSYDSGSAVWQMYEIADRDWEKSPASSISGYNSKTNKISGYTYGTSTSSKGSNPYVHALYNNRDVDNGARAWDSHGERSNAWTIEREHVWPKSQGFEASGAGGARGDPMHLMAANGTSNGMHSNLFYGYVDKSKTYKDAGSTHSSCSGNLTGTSKTIKQNTVFEPQDSDKGDIARAIFYMVARYNYLSKSDSDGINTNNPNLTLVQEDNYYSSYTSSTSTPGKMGIMTDLLNWHHIDPVDEFEIHRNNLLYTNFTNNRNPFIDFPEWADFIWGTVSYTGRQYNSYSSTPTGYATPSSDKINGYNDQGGSSVAVTGVELDESSIEVEVGSADTLVATVSPSNASDKSVTWESANSSIATVTNGVVRGISVGTTTITVTTTDGSYTDTCSVEVKAASGGGDTPSEPTTVSTTIATYASSNNWVSGTKYENLSLDGNVTLTASSQGNNTNTGKYYSTGNDWRFYQSESGAIQISVSSGYELDSVTFTYNATNNGVLKDTNGTTISTGTAVSLSGDSVTFNAGSTSGANGNVKITEISVTYHSTSAPVKTLSSIAVKTPPNNLSYVEGDSFSPTGLVITATYSDSTTSDITYSDNEDEFDFEPSDNLQVGDTSITISFEGKTCSQAISVSASSKTLDSISIHGQTTSFEIGDDFEFGGVVTATFSNSSTEDVTSSATFSGYNMNALGAHTVTVSYTYKGSTESASYTIIVNDANAKSYKRITSMDDIEDGGRYVLVGYRSSSSQYYAMPSYSSGNNIPGVAVTLTNNNTVLPQENMSTAAVYTLETTGTANKYYISDGSKYLFAAGSGSSNYLRAKATTDSTAGAFTISYSTFFSVVAASSNRNTMRFNDTNSPPIFSCYASNANQTEIMFFKEVVEGPSYSLVTDISSLRTDDNVVFVGVDNSKYYEASTISGSVLRCVSTETPSANKVTIKEGATSFLVVRDGNYLRFRDIDNGFLSSYSSSSYCKYESVGSETNKSLFSITLGNNSMVSSMEGQDTSVSSRFFKFHPTDKTERFTFYTSTNGYAVNFYLYKKTSQVEADSWSSSFLTNTKKCSTTSWTSLASSYDALSSNAKTEIISCTALDDSNYCTRSQAMARYEYMLGDSRYSPFITAFITGRNISPAKPNILPILFINNSSTMIIIVVISLVSVSAIGGYFFMRSRKKEEF